MDCPHCGWSLKCANCNTLVGEQLATNGIKAGTVKELLAVCKRTEAWLCSRPVIGIFGGRRPLNSPVSTRGEAVEYLKAAIAKVQGEA